MFEAINLKLNRVSNVEVVAEACGARSGVVDFFIADHHHASSLHLDWASGGGHRGQPKKIETPMTTLDEFFASEGRKLPRFIKFDIEGGCTEALPGCRQVLKEGRPFILVESHTPDEDRAVSNVLTEFGYRGYRLDDRAWVKKPEAVHPDKQGVWGTLLLTPEEHYKTFFSAISG